MASSRRSFFARFAVWIVLGFLFAAPLSFYSAGKTIRSNTNKVEDWLPASFRETSELKWFRRHFVSDQFVIVSWEGCLLGGDPAEPEGAADDPRIEQLASLLVNRVPDAESTGTEDFSRYFASATTARRVLNELTEGPAAIPYEEAAKRLSGTLIGPDGRHTCVLITLTPAAAGDLRAAVGRGITGRLLVRRAPGALHRAIAAVGIQADAVHLGGPAVDSTAIDEEGERTLVRLAALSGAFGLGLAWWSLRSLKLTVIVFLCAVLSAALALGLVWLTGATGDAVLMSMPSVVYVLAISGAVHLINYYRDAVQEIGLEGAPERAVAHAWRPALLCSATTAFGLLSLLASDITPIRKFGLYSALGVFGTLAVLFLLLPAALHLWPPQRRRETSEPGRGPANGTHGVASHWIDRLWAAVGDWVIRRYALVMLVCLALVVFAGMGLMRVRTSIDLLKLFDDSADILVDYAWLEKHLGRLIPMEVVIRIPQQLPSDSGNTSTRDPAQLSFLEQMELVDQVRRAIEQELGPEGEDVVGRTMSAVTFAPQLSGADASTASFVRRATLNRRLSESRAGFERGGFLRTDDDNSQLWRLSIRVAAFENVDYARFNADLKRAVEPVLEANQYRGEVFRYLADKRAGESIVGAHVLLWGHDGQPPQMEGDSERNVLRASLGESLRRARLRVYRSEAAAAETSLTQLERLRKFDCVALLGPASASELKLFASLEIPVLELHSAAGSGAVASDSPAPQDSKQVSAVYTGVVPIVYKAQRALLDSLVESTFWSFLTITPLMMFISRSVSAGLVVMIPNLLPVVAVFGGMGWLGIDVDIGSMMSASIALGVAVDDTIHFMAWYRSDLNELGSRRLAILAAYRRCATPTLQAALISGLGLSVFALSTFTPTQKFGWLMLVILIAGVVAELFLLPALLASPLGSVFRIRPKKAADGESTPPATIRIDTPNSAGNVRADSAHGASLERGMCETGDAERGMAS